MGAYAKVLAISGSIGIAIIMGIIGYGELSKPPGSTFLEKPDKTWMAGNGVEAGMVMKYLLEDSEKNYSKETVTLQFERNESDNNAAKWIATITIDDSEHKILLTRQLIPAESVNDKELQRLKNTLFWIVDYAAKPQYLAGGAVWDTITYETQTVNLWIVSKEKISIEGGAFDSHILSYDLGKGKGRFWIVENIPLPVKGELYNNDGSLRFKYELLSYNIRS